MKIKNYSLKLFATFLLSQIVIGQVFSQAVTELKPRSLPGFKLKSQVDQNLVVKKQREIIREKDSQVSTKAPGDTLFFQNFQGAGWPANMVRLNVDGRTPAANQALFGSNAWVAATAPGNPNRMAGSTSYFNPAGVANRWMTTPAITLTAGNVLRWKAKAFEPQAPDGYEVRICTTCTAAPTVGNVVANFTALPALFSIVAEQSSTNLIEREVDLSAYAGQTVRLAFRNNSNDQFILFIDDILVFKLPPVDISAERIFSPDTSIYRCDKSNFPAIVQIKNKGGATARNIKVKLESTGPIVDSVVTFLDSLEAGQLDTVRFNEGLNFSQIGNYQLRLTTSVPEDLIRSNNTLLDKYNHPAPLDAPISFDFEELDTEDNSLPPNWNSSSIFIPLRRNEGFNGGNALRFPVYNDNATFGSSPENRFITNEFTNIPAGQSFSLKFKLFTQTTPDYTMIDGDTVSFRVIKRNCSQAGPATLVTSANQFISADYQKAFISLDGLGITSNDTISFEIKAKAAQSTQWYYLEIDDVSIGTVQDNDIAIIDVQRPPLSIVKRNQVSAYQVKGLVFNEGLTPISPVRISAKMNPLGQEDTARINTVGSGLSRNFTTTPGLINATLGDYTIDVNLIPGAQADPNPVNNLVSFPLTISDSTLAKDVGEQFVSPGGTSGLGYGSQGGLKIMATSIATKARDTLTSVSVFVGSLSGDVVGKAFFASTNAVGAFSLDSSSTSVTIPQTDENSWQTFRFRLRSGTAAVRDRGRAVLPNSTNLYGVKISAGDLRVGFNFDGAVDDGSYIYFGTALTPTQEITIFGLGGPFNLFIRPNFGRPATMVSATQIEKSLQYAELIPNPSNGQSTLSIQLNKAKSVDIQIFSTDGRLISTKTASTNVGDNRIDLPVSSLKKGIYLVKVASEGFSVTKKLVVE